MIVLLLVAALLGLGVVISVSASGTPVETAVVRLAPIREFVDERGKTRLPQTYLITMPFEGRIEAIGLSEGMPVKKDEVVARVVPHDMELTWQAANEAVQRLEASIKENDDATVEKTGLKQSLSYVESMNHTVEAARARVEAGKARLDFADRNLSRIEDLRAKQAATPEELDQARVNQVSARVDHEQDVLVLRALESLQAATALLPTAITEYIDRKALAHNVLEKQWAEADINRQQIDKNRERGEMKSPIDGVVLERAVNNERQLSAGATLLKLGRLDELEVEADILSQDVVNVKRGDEAEIYGPAIGPQPVTAHVTTIYPAGFTKVSSLGVEQQRVKVVLQFNPADLARLRKERALGVDYRVRVRIFTAEQPQANVIPRSALFKGAAGEWQLFAVQGGRARLLTVSVGLMNDDYVQIDKGVQPGDEVILAPETSLTEGAKVKPNRQSEAAATQHSGD
jgi:HlyD family secretion protein